MKNLKAIKRRLLKNEFTHITKQFRTKLLELKDDDCIKCYTIMNELIKSKSEELLNEISINNSNDL